MFSPQLLDHFQNPRNLGELAAPAVTVEVSNPACGDEMRLSARIEGGRIAEVRYKVRGCTASIAAGSALTELLVGRPVERLREVGAVEVETAVGGLMAESRHAAVLCRDAVTALAALASGKKS
jgi:nitrogen fixation NifU-like protein